MTEAIPDARQLAPRPLRLLLIDDNPHDRELVTRALSRHFGALTILPVRDAAEFEHVLSGEAFAAAIIDYQLNWATGIQVLRKIRRLRPDCSVLMFTASGDTDIAVEAMKEGLDDYITKTSKHYSRLPYALDAALERMRQRRELAAAQAEHDRLSQQVATGQQQLHFALQSAGLISWEADLTTGALHLSPNGAEVLGAQWTSIQRAIASAHPADVASAKAAYESAIETGDAFICELRVTRAADERQIWLEIRGQPLPGVGGAIAEIVGVAADITARKQAEDALRQADRRKDAFLATLAHELRNPLAPIRYATRLLEPGVPAQMASDARRMIDRQLAHMARLLDDLLDVSRVTRGVLEIRREQLDLREVIESAVASARPLAEAGRQELTVNLPAAPLAVNGDAIRLVQVVSNLLNNATKYTPTGGHIVVNAFTDGEEVVISVKDDGVGIAPEALPTIFELFVQLDPAGTRAAGGLGIGLSLARDLIKLHNGRLEAHSAGRSSGSEFIVRLPRAKETPALTQPLAAPEKITALGASGVRVLIVDDNIDAATSLSYVLNLAGYQVSVAHDGDRALEQAQQLRPDVVLLDIGLPGMSGHEVARRLRAQPWGKDLQLIAVTGWGQEGDRTKSLQAGFDEHLTKPIDPELLLRRIALAKPLAPAGAALGPG